MSVADVIRLRQIEATLAELLERVQALEAGECPVCAQRRAGAAARQRHHRSRDELSDPVARDCLAKMPPAGF